MYGGRCCPRRVLGTACGQDGAKLRGGGTMANTFQRLSKWLLVGGGVLVLAGVIFALVGVTTSGGSVFAQASPAARTATPASVGAAPAQASPTPVRTATPAAP